MFTNITFNILGIVLFIFLFWKRLKEDYSTDMIFTTCLYALLGIGIFRFLSLKFFPSWWFWLSFLGLIAGLTLGILKFHLRVYETLEASTISFLPWLSLVFLLDSINNFSTYSFAAFVFCLVLVFVFYFLETHYKNFSWYRSGRIGFAGLATLGFLFLTRTAIAIIPFKMLSFAGIYEAYISGILTFVCFALVANLAR